MAKASMPHVAALAYLTQGHVNPLLRFCFKLASNGVRITFITIAVTNAPIFTTTNEEPPPEGLAFESLPMDLSSAPILHAPAIFQSFCNAVEGLQGPFDKLLEKLAPVNLIISDCMYWWTHASAKKLGIPRISFWTTSAASLNIDFHVPLLMSKGDIPVEESNMDALVDYVPGLPPLRGRDIPVMYHAGNLMTITDPGYARKIARSVVLKDDSWLVVNSFEELEAEGFKQARKLINNRCIGLGPLLPPKFLGLEVDDRTTDKQEKQYSIKWLDTKPPRSVVFVSFGTAARPSSDEYEQLLKGLEESGVYFLWSLGKKGGDRSPNAADGKGLMVDWVPQAEVLCHTSVAAFVSHCGWNSVLESICGGVPILGVPKAAEQNLNCKMLSDDLGIGLRLHLSSGNVAAVVRGVTENEEMRAKVFALSKIARKSGLEQGTLESLIRDIKSLTK